jgi:hypothetical protein
MLDNPRFNAALSASNEWNYPNARQVQLDQQYLTQKALGELSIDSSTPPSNIPKADRILMIPEKIEGLRRPYAVEVLGMPGSGKTTCINRYLEELWSRQKRHLVAFVDEGARKLKEQYGDLRYSDPFTFSMMAGSTTFAGHYMQAIAENTHVIVADRGQIDRRVFRRFLFTQGHVHPGIMEDEAQFIYGLENTPVQICGIINFLVRPDVSIQRIKKEGPVVNMRVLPQLYEQYLRLHSELINWDPQTPYRIYEMIDAEKLPEEVYEQFKYVMDHCLNLPDIMLHALSRVVPDEFDKAKAEYDRKANKGYTHAEMVMSRRLGGKRVHIVGGDEMELDEEILTKPFVEAVIPR